MPKLYNFIQFFLTVDQITHTEAESCWSTLHKYLSKSKTAIIAINSLTLKTFFQLFVLKVLANWFLNVRNWILNKKTHISLFLNRSCVTQLCFEMLEEGMCYFKSACYFTFFECAYIFLWKCMQNMIIASNENIINTKLRSK